MRVTIFGATGMLGKALTRQWAGDEVIPLGSAKADIRNPDQVAKVFEQAQPDWTVLAAAYTDVDGCELNPTLASAVNTQGAINVAKAAANAGSKLLLVSTDYVFDGKKTSPYETDDVRNPINAYGRTKAEAEEIARVLPHCCIVRTSWLFGLGGKCFPDTILKLAVSRPEIDVVNDQRGCPTYTVDLADAIIKLCKSEAKGIIHCTNRGECSWYDFACEIIRQSGMKTTIRPTTSDRFIRPTERPRYSVLSLDGLAKYGIEMRPWQEALADYLSHRGG
jgi:dTDP-4-dehydrorhamnose reductase